MNAQEWFLIILGSGLIIAGAYHICFFPFT